MPKLLRFIFLLVVCLGLSSCVLLVRKMMTDDERVRQISIGKDIRRYYLYVPTSYKQGTNVPLVVVLHGGGGNGIGAERMTGFSRKADSEGFLVLYPYGWGRLDERLLTWNAGNCCGKSLDDNKDDVEFLKQLILFTKNQYSVDENRIYATGMSNGGMMTYRLGCELSDLIAAIAPVSGAQNVPQCSPKNPVSVIIFHGREDQHVLFNGGKPKTNFDSHDRIDKSVEFATSFWSAHNVCSDPQSTKKGKVSTTNYSCEKGDLRVYAIDGEGHTWPGGEKGRRGADAPTQEISATDTIWEFFKAHPKVR